ncbi:type II toxin-antitoxin system RelE/ParE family toxin [Hellea sp.]|nr:type II toxin-antitoxin system RelE/ParE family toxin [Hellea sp.]
MKLTWLEQAELDVRRLYQFLAKINRDAAERAVETIVEASYELADHPEIGRVASINESYREWPAKFGAKAYIIRYKIIDGTVIILRVWHGLEER